MRLSRLSTSRQLNRPLLRVAAGTAGLIVMTPAAFSQAVNSSGVAEENTVIVTANKRAQDLRDVAGSVSAYTGEQLEAIGAQSLSDYVTRLPGVVFNDYQPGVSEVVIRGIAATTYHEQGQTVVGYYVNEIPLSEPGWPIVIPDVDTFDLERVEVLRGPQGTLFGSASLGGLVNYIAKSADASDFDAALQTSVGTTSHSDDMNYAVKGMVNVPLIEDKLAIRVVGLERVDAGYVDNVRLNSSDSNELTTRGGRVSAVFTPTETTRLSWLTLYQETDLEDQTYVTIPTLTRETYVPEPHETEMLIHSLRLDQELGFGDLTVLGAMADKESALVFDYTGNYGENFQAGGPVFGVGEAESKSRNLEVRLSSPGEGFVDWVVGAMYLKSEKDSIDRMRQVGIESFLNATDGTGSALAPGDDFDRYIVARDDEETAVFGEVTFNFSDTWALTAGGRLFEAKSDNSVLRRPGLDIPAGASFTQSTSEDGFTPKVSVSWKPSGDLMMYATYSEGFRVGGANPNPPGTVTDARAYDSDSVTNYEIGVRSTLAGGALLLDAAAFHIKWDDIQVRLFGPAPTFYSYVTNAGGAENDGVEFTGTVRPNDVFEFQTSVTYIDAQVSSFVPDTFAPGGGYAKGTTLPGSSEWTISNSVSLGFRDAPLAPFVLLMHRYLSEAPVAFGSAFEKGDYHIVDLRAGLTFSKAVEVSVFANNLLDEYGTLNAPFANAAAPLGSVTRPRTLGVTMNWSFQ